MASVTFILKDPQLNIKPKDQKETLVYMVFRYNNNRLKLSTSEKILPRYWDRKNQGAFNNPNFSKDDFNQKLINKKALILDIYRKLINDDLEPNNNNIQFEFNKLDKDRKLRNTKTNTPFNLNQYIENYIKEIEIGKRLTPEKKEKFKKGTIKNYAGFKVQFDNYQKEKRKTLNFEDITIDFYDDFIKFFTNKNYSPNTIGRHIKNLKTILRSSRDEGLHKNLEIDRRMFKVLKVDTDQIYLTQKEINKIYELDLSEKPLLDIARDVFLVGCYTAQRFSDYSRIGKNNIKILENGMKIIDIIQNKTGERVKIPIHHQLEKILEKYNYQLPKIFEQKLNERIKKVGEIAKIKESVTIETIKGGLKIKKDSPKHELIKTHTARRSGATNMYLAGIPPLDIMKITGHKTEREFLKYIRVTKEQTAEMLANHEYFRPILKVI